MRGVRPPVGVGGPGTSNGDKSETTGTGGYTTNPEGYRGRGQGVETKSSTGSTSGSTTTENRPIAANEREITDKALPKESKDHPLPSIPSLTIVPRPESPAVTSVTPKPDPSSRQPDILRPDPNKKDEESKNRPSPVSDLRSGLEKSPDRSPDAPSGKPGDPSNGGGHDANDPAKTKPAEPLVDLASAAKRWNADPKNQEKAERLLEELKTTDEGKLLLRFPEQWGELPAKQRVEEFEKLSKNLPPAKREAIKNLYYSYMLNDNGTPNKEPVKGPAVWHRDRQQPTMARVYVGDGNSLELVSLNVTTTVEGPRARTVVDHIFRNPHPRQLEGTFEYPLPTGASPSYFAMFLGQTRDTVPARFGRRDVAAAARRRPGAADAGRSSSSTSTPPTGASCARRASSTTRRRWRPTRTSFAAGSIRRCWNTPAATPSAAGSSRFRRRATTASSSPTKRRCRSPRARWSIASRCPACSSRR